MVPDLVMEKAQGATLTPKDDCRALILTTLTTSTTPETALESSWAAPAKGERWADDLRNWRSTVFVKEERDEAGLGSEAVRATKKPWVEYRASIGLDVRII